MDTPSPIPPTPDPFPRRTGYVLAGLSLGFAGLLALFAADPGLWGRPPARPAVPPVDVKFLDTAPWRRSYADLVAAKEDLSDFDCYACHEKNKPPPIRYDANHRIILPKEHSNFSMAHGSHDRNNQCYNCHNESNLVTLQARDGRELKFDNSVPLCGSCHGPTYRDWEGGAHGRTSGHWDAKSGPSRRLVCVNCHDPHQPRIPGRAAAPGPRSLREETPPAVPVPPTSTR
ncbi:MAG: hypothetical protein HZC55_17570 [Verrucomicrobia bacterium]|nr:hypothetical protein [Verrucomicrobiota bacterium]